MWKLQQLLNYIDCAINGKISLTQCRQSTSEHKPSAIDIYNQTIIYLFIYLYIKSYFLRYSIILFLKGFLEIFKR